LGHAAPKFNPARFSVEGPYLIPCETRPDRDDGPVDWVEIVRVVDGRRDLAKLI
jgi:toxin ParE1/3/4